MIERLIQTPPASDKDIIIDTGDAVVFSTAPEAPTSTATTHQEVPNRKYWDMTDVDLIPQHGDAIAIATALAVAAALKLAINWQSRSDK
jgi:hypothetical protein